MRFVATLLGALLVSAGGQALSIELELHGDGHCPARAELMSAMHRQLAGQPETERLRLELWRSKSGLTVVLHARNISRRRSVTVGDSACSEVAETIAFLTRSWLAGMPQVPMSSMATAPRTPTAEESTTIAVISAPALAPPAASPAEIRPVAPPRTPIPEDVPDIASSPRRDPAVFLGPPPSAARPGPPAGFVGPAEPVRVTPVPPAPEPTPTPMAEHTAPNKAPAPQPVSTPVAEHPAPVEAAPAQPAPTARVMESKQAGVSPHLSLLLSGGGAVSAGRTEGGLWAREATAALDVRLQRWHLVAEGSWLSPLVGSLPPGTISIDRTGLSLLAGFAVIQTGRFALEPIGGPRVELWQASSSGFTKTGKQTVWVPGGSLGVRGRVALVWRVFAFVSVQGNLVAARSFEITDLAGAVSPPSFWGSAEAGLGLRFW